MKTILGRVARLPLILLLFSWASGCAPTVRVAPPEEPIVINMNIKIEHEIKVKVDKDLENLFDEESDIF